MTELEKIFITSGLTIFGGVIVYALGQVLSKVWIEPAQDLRKTIAETRVALAVHAPIIHTPISRTKETSEAASAALRKCSAELFARVHAIPAYGMLSAISGRYLPKRKLAVEAVRELRALSTYVFDTGDKARNDLDIIRKIVDRIELHLGLEPLQ